LRFLRNFYGEPRDVHHVFLAYLASRSIFFLHESAGRGALYLFLSQSAFFFREMRRQAGLSCRKNEKGMQRTSPHANFGMAGH
jgi:hypothetical protein